MRPADGSKQQRLKKRCGVLLILIGVWLFGWLVFAAIDYISVGTYGSIGMLGLFVMIATLVWHLIMLIDAATIDMMTSHGFSIVPTATTPVEIKSLFDAASKVGSKGEIVRVATRVHSDGVTWYICHSTQRGKSQTVCHAFVIRTESNWPLVRIRSKTVFTGIERFMSDSFVKFDESEFNERIAVKSDDAGFANRMFNRDLWKISDTLGGGELVIGGGGVVLVFWNPADCNRWEHMITTFERVLAAVPREVPGDH